MLLNFHLSNYFTKQVREEIGAIKSSFIFRNTVILLGGEKNITADDYLLKSPENVLVLAWRFAHDKTYVNLVKIILTIKIEKAQGLMLSTSEETTIKGNSTVPL
jgi:hypothetical protein